MSEHAQMFKATLTKMESNWAHIEIEVDSKEVDKAFARAYKRVARQVNIPGFRRGKAPRGVLRRHVGQGPIYEEALDDLIPHAYAHAIADIGLEPIDQPQIGAVDLEEGQPFKFNLEVEVRPEVELGDYRSLEVPYPPVEVSEEEIEETIEGFRQQHARQIVEDEGVEAADGHFVVVDYETEVDGEAIPEARDEGVTLHLGAEQYLPEFEEGLRGMKMGESRELQIPFPEDYPHEGLAGKTATMRVTMQEIKRKEVPPLDDELAKTMGFDSLEALRADVEGQLKTRAEQAARETFRNAVIKAAVDQARLEVPDTLVQRAAASRRQDMLDRLEASGLTLEQYLESVEETEEGFEAELEREAAERVRIDLVLDAIGRREELRPSEEDLHYEAQTMSQMYHQPVEEMRRFIDREDVREQIETAIIRRKVADFLVELAKADDVAAGGADDETAAEGADGEQAVAEAEVEAAEGAE